MKVENTTDTTQEIYCDAGKITVQLPKDAWIDLIEPGIEIEPCNGCQHPFHLKQIQFFQKEEKAAELVNLVTARNLSHHVSVIETYLSGKRKETVFCTCNCKMLFPNYKSNRPQTT